MISEPDPDLEAEEGGSQIPADGRERLAETK